MHKKIAALLVFTNMFANIACFSKPMSLTAEQTQIQKSAPILRERGKLFFQFTSFAYAPEILRTLKGQWQVLIITPDLKTYKGPKIDASAPPTSFAIIVDSPILFGNYLIVVENINARFKSGNNFRGSFINPDVAITNTFNAKVADAYILSAQNQALISAKNPIGSSIQGYFVPPFIPKQAQE